MIFLMTLVIICFSRDLSRRVSSGQDSWAWQVQSLAYMINTSTSTTNNEATVLMKACQRDILDLFPADQKLLTEIAKDCVSDCQMKEGRSSSVHNNTILAYTFQEMELSTQTVLDNMKADNLEADITTHHYLLDHLCKLSTRGRPVLIYLLAILPSSSQSLLSSM